MIRHHKKGIESKMSNENALIKDLPCLLSEQQFLIVITIVQ